MSYHRVFYRKPAAACSQKLIVRCTVFTGIQDTAVLYGVLHPFNTPVIRLQSAVPYRVHSSDRIHHIGSGTGNKIDIVCRLLKYDDILRKPIRHFTSIRHNQNLLIFRQCDQEKISLTAVN